MRADAERNRQRLLEAAAELFAAKGLSVGLDEIARHAGVGVGTAYRRFPDKAQLIDALFEDRLGRLVALAEEGLAVADPWAGFAGFMEGAVELHSSHRAVKELLFGAGYAAEWVGLARERLGPLVSKLVRRAQASGHLRSHVRFTDMPLHQYIISGIGDFGGPHTEGLWRRYLTIVLDGLRTPEPTRLTPPALTLDAFAQTIAATSG